MTEEQENGKLQAFERNNYFYGKLMTVRDFDLEQDYINEKRWLINRLLFGSGVICGLAVTTDTDLKKIIISPGLAIDPHGCEILVPEPWETDVSNLEGIVQNAEGSYFIVLSYDECLKDRVKAHDSSTCSEICQCSRVEERFSVKAVPSSQIPERTCETFDLWSNRLDLRYDLSYPAGTAIGTYTRRIPRYVQPGQLFEITMQITNDSPHTITIEDELKPEYFKLVYGTTKLVSSHQKEIVTGKYVARAITTGSITGTYKCDAHDMGKFTETESLNTITIIPYSIKDKIWLDFVKTWRIGCPDGARKDGVILARIDIDGQGKVTGSTPTPFPKSVVYDTALTGTLLECLREEVMALENQTMRIKERIAPSKITLSASPTALQTKGSSIITIKVTNDQDTPLSGIPVNLITTLGTISPTSTETGEDGQKTVTLTAGETAGTATVIAHTTSGIGVTQIQITSGTPNTGTLDVDSTPQGAAIFVNGNMWGATSSHGIVLTSGEYKIELKMPNYDVYTQNITIKANEKITITATLTKQKGAINVKSTPTGATIYLDGNQWGTTDTTLPNIPVGTHNITLKKSGYVDATQPVTVAAGATANVAITLTPVSSTGTIGGIVKSEDGNLIQGATVTLEKGTDKKTTPTGANGRYTFNVIYGQYTIKAHASGYIDSSPATITLSGSTAPDHLIVLKKEEKIEFCAAVSKPLERATIENVVGRYCPSYGPVAEDPGAIYSNPADVYAYRDTSTLEYTSRTASAAQPATMTLGPVGKGTVKEPKTKPAVTKKQAKKKKTVP